MIVFQIEVPGWSRFNFSVAQDQAFKAFAYAFNILVSCELAFHISKKNAAFSVNPPARVFTGAPLGADYEDRTFRTTQADVND